MSQDKGVSDDFRRKWDKDEYERLAKERLSYEEDRDRDFEEGKKKPGPKRELLKQRDYKVDLDSRLGKSQVITKTASLANQGGYYCNVCDCVVKDSINFLDHINGRKHQRNLGMSMRIERSTLSQVKSRFDSNKKKAEEKKKEYTVEERLKEIQEEEEKLKAYRKERKKAQKRSVGSEWDSTVAADPDLISTMGFSGFGDAKKKK